MRKAIITIIALAATVLSFAEGDNVLLRGFVFDSQTKDPLAMAAVRIKGTQLGGIAEDNGYFEIPVPQANLKDGLTVSFIGYKSQDVSIRNYQPSEPLKIYLEEDIQVKQEVEIVAENAKGVLLKAILAMKKNFYFDSVVATGLYRQYHKENGTYVRLIEADASIAFNVKSPYKYSFHELIKVNKQRRSENYETNGDEHGDHMVDLLKENPYSYNRNNFLNPKNLDFYAPKFAGGDSVTHIISVQYKENSSQKLEQAKIWVHRETYAITRMEIEKFPNPYYVKTLYANDSRWKLVNEKDIIETKPFNGKYMIKSIQRSYNHHVMNRQTNSVDFVVEESFDFFFDDYETDEVGAMMKKGYDSFSELYLAKYKYDSKFWDNYDLLEDYPLNPQVKKDLEHAKPLATQFVDAGR